MVIYPFLAYKLIDVFIASSIFNNNMFLVYWRNKINNHYFMNYHQYNIDNTKNSLLYDTYATDRKLSFYANFSLKNLMLLSDIKKYLLELFYSTSFFGCVNFNDINFNKIKMTLNTVSLSQLDSNIFLSDNTINTYNNLKVITSYIITDYVQNNYSILINRWDNNSKYNSSYSIIINSISYTANTFKNIDFNLTLMFNYLPLNFDSFILKEVHLLKIPLILFESAPVPSILFNSIIILSKQHIIDLLQSENIFELNNLIINVPNIVIDYTYYLKLVTIEINNKKYRYIIDIQNVDDKYQIISEHKISFNKNDIESIVLEFINIIYRDIATKDGSTIIDNTFIINNRNDWKYDPLKTYWLYNKNDYIHLQYRDGLFIVNDKLENLIYTIREISNSSLPSFLKLINYYKANNNISDLYDFTFQTSMIFLVKTEVPYFYFYNIPFIINKSEIYLNDSLVTKIIPLSSNQFFENDIAVLYDQRNLLNNITHYELVKYVSNSFDEIFLQSEYINIINTLEQAKLEILNLNMDFINNTTYYGSTTNTIINNIININNYDLVNFSNEDFDNCNKLAFDVYKNSELLILNSNKAVLNIYNYPVLSRIPNRKISNNLINYLKNISVYFKEQFLYINKNSDYSLIFNENQYNNQYTSIGDIKSTIQNNIFDFNNDYKIELLYPLCLSTDVHTLYYNDQRINIKSTSESKTLISDSFNIVINNDDQYETDIYYSQRDVFDNEKFNFMGYIYFKQNIFFSNIIDINNYNYIKLDNNNFYNLIDFQNNLSIELNVTFNNSFLYNISDLSNNNIFYSITNISNNLLLLYYYKIKIDLSGILIGDIGNCLYINKKIYFFEVINYLQNIINIISVHKFDIYNSNYIIGNLIITNINNILYSSYIDLIKPIFINLSNFTIIEIFEFNYYSQDVHIYNNFIVNNTLNPVIRKVNIYNFILLNNNNLVVTLFEKKYNIVKLPPFNLINNKLVSFNDNVNIFFEKSNNCLVKLDNYIFNMNDLSNNILNENNYALSILPIQNPNLIYFKINGDVIKEGLNKIIINFQNLLEMPNTSYYLINGCYIYIEKLKNQVIIYDDNIEYYNTGTFNKIYLLDNIYFNNRNPLFYSYEYKLLKEDLIGNIISDKNDIPVKNIIV